MWLKERTEAQLEGWAASPSVPRLTSDMNLTTHVLNMTLRGEQFCRTIKDRTRRNDNETTWIIRCDKHCHSWGSGT